MTTVAQRLAEAEAAYHSLMVGGRPVRVRDSNGEEVEFGKARAADLAAYIASLRRELSGQIAPQTIRIRTSKGI